MSSKQSPRREEMGQERSMDSRLLEEAKRRRTIPIHSEYIVLRLRVYGNRCSPKKEVMEERQGMVIEWLEPETGELQ
jgi:hypothetical protein